MKMLFGIKKDWSFNVLAFFDLMLSSYIQVIAVNGQFPGPLLNATTNYNVVVNVFNHLDEPLLLTW